MANEDQAQGGQGGGRTYTEEDVMTLMNEAARRAASEAVKKTRKEEDEDDSAVSVINPKVVKQLKDTVAVFTALKELSSNPLQKTIEETVGGMAASVVQNAFAPRGPPPKQDIVDKILNSQFAYGLGSGLGQRGPELVETMGKTFGSEKAGQMIDNMIGRSGQSGQSRQLSPSNPGPSNPSSSPSSEPKADKQSEKELLLSLDPNNPEHISAYAETQGGLPVDVARKMLMIHQDAFIEQLKKEGTNVDQISTQRGSHAQPQPPPHPQQSAPLEQNISQQVPVGRPDMQYAEYRDVSQPTPPQTNNPMGNPTNNQDNQQVEMMKTFANDIGKVMGEMLNRIETLNNTVFTLQNDVNTMRKQEVQPVQPARVSTIPPILSGIPSGIQTISEQIPPVPIIRSAPIPTEIETFEDSINEEPETVAIFKGPRTSGEFFEENVQNAREFIKELEEESQKSQKQISPLSIPASSKQMIPSVPPPVAQAVPTTPPPNMQKIPLPTITKPAQAQIQPLADQSKALIEINEEKIDIKDNEEKKTDIKDKIEDVEIKENLNVDKNSDKFVTPIKKVGIHKKAGVSKNMTPSFKKNDDS